MEDENQILSTLEDAEKRVDSLKALIQGHPEEERISMHRPTVIDNRESSVSARESLYSKRYMTMSTTLLFENEGIEVFRIPDSVGLYFIVPTTKVRTAARSAVLRIVRIDEKHRDDIHHPPAFLQVGEWIYPLMPGSMVYRSRDKYYLFPDLLSTSPGTSVGVVLPKSCSPVKREEFETLILGFTGLKEFPPQPPAEFGRSTDLIMDTKTSVALIRTDSGVYSQRWSKMYQERKQGGTQTGGNCGCTFGKRLGIGIQAGAELVAKGLELGAVGTANAIQMGTSCLKSALPEGVTDSEIPETVTEGVFFAKEATEKVVEISASIMATVTEITANLAGLTACYIKAASEPVISTIVEYTGISQETCCTLTAEAKDFGEGVALGTIMAYEGLQKAGIILAEAVKSNAADVVNHCYGPSAAEVLQEAAEVVGNVTMTGLNAGSVMDGKKFVRKTMTQTGIAIWADDCGGPTKSTGNDQNVRKSED